ncbi:MAG: hypothetical protein E7294_05035 [Lachnospiraceae bacterium]|nr:hypothetical protein [Lachnospiraceae bacterium]
MAKYIEHKEVRFTEITDLNGNPIIDRHYRYIGLAGMLCIYESEHRAPGKHFVYFYPNEPYSSEQRWFNTISGELIETGNKIYVETGERYVFEVGNYMSEDDRVLLWLNVFCNWNRRI